MLSFSRYYLFGIRIFHFQFLFKFIRYHYIISSFSGLIAFAQSTISITPTSTVSTSPFISTQSFSDASVGKLKPPIIFFVHSVTVLLHLVVLKFHLKRFLIERRGYFSFFL